MTKFVKKQHSKLVHYVLSGLLLVVSLIVGVFLDKKGNAIAFLVIQIVTAFWLVDKPIRIGAFLGIGGIIFICMVIWQKQGEMMNDDIVNEVTILVMTFFISNKMYKLRLARLEKYQELVRLSEYDSLTGLPNRRRFYNDISKTYGKWISMYMIDIDWFKNYNDKHGHLGGDYALEELGKVFSKLEAEGIHIYRYGGEEFIAYTENRGVLAEGEKILYSVLHEAIPYPESKYGYITISIGAVRTLIVSIKEVENLIQESDEALYKAKESRNTIYVG